ncbi:MAG: SLOG family protein [Oscillospiraceae bacterium]|nr:SLOG family protein [Oscillospiraceae bacterium]
MREHTACFTGHRDLPTDTASLRTRAEAVIRELHKEGVTDYWAGGALGFDTLAALAVLDLAEELSGLTLRLALPCREQARGWSPRDALLYERIKERAAEVVYIAEAYLPGCMQARNRYLVDQSAHCIFYSQRAYGGTAYTVDYAGKQGLMLHPI